MMSVMFPQVALTFQHSLQPQIWNHSSCKGRIKISLSQLGSSIKYMYWFKCSRKIKLATQMKATVLTSVDI